MTVAQHETHKARTLLANKPEQATRLIHFLNTSTGNQLATLNIQNMAETIVRVKKVLTMRNFVQTIERKCQEMQIEVNAFRHRLANLQAKGLPNLVTSAGRLLKQEQYANRLSTFIENQITTSSNNTEVVPPTGQSLYDKLEDSFYIEHEVAHLFPVWPNYYTYNEVDETLYKLRKHQLPTEDWWQSLLQIFKVV